MTLGDRLRQARGTTSQRVAADGLGVARELVSMWETGARAPSDEYMVRLARAYGVSYGWLAGTESGDGWTPREILFRKSDAPPSGPERVAIDDWLVFLDRWSARLGDLGAQGEQGRGLRHPPRPLDTGGAVRDTRRAPTLAALVREHLRVGDGPLPDLYALLDAFGVLVYRSDELPHLDRDGVVSGAFANHPELGYCVFVNTQCSSGRQAFTLAHELAHALFHHTERATVSRSGDRAQEERFANAFASHLLVPGRELKHLAKTWLAGSVTEYGAVQLAAHFRVSYAMMLFRLLDEKLATRADISEWKSYSPVAMAERLGLSADAFCHAPMRADDELDRFPLSVRNVVHQALAAGRIALSQAADILDVDEDVLQSELGPPSERDDRGSREFSEYPLF